MKTLYPLALLLILALQIGCSPATAFEGRWTAKAVWPNAPEPFLTLNHDGTFSGAQGEGKWVVDGSSVILTAKDSKANIARYRLLKSGELANEGEPRRAYTKFFNYSLKRMD